MRRVVLVILLALFVVAALAVGIAAGTSPQPDSLPQGVSIGGVPVAGLSPDEAKDALGDELSDRLRRPIEIKVGETVVTWTPTDLGLSVDTEASMGQIVKPGGTGFLERLWTRVGGTADRRDYPLVVEVDEVTLTSAIDEIALPAERLVKDGRIMFDGGRPKAVAAETGILLDREALQAALIEAVASHESSVVAPLTEVPPGVSTDDAQRALELVRGALSAPMTLGYQGAMFEIPPSDLAAIAAPNPGGIKTGAPITFDTDEARVILGERLESIQNPPVEAEIVPDQDGKGFSIKPSEDGTLVEWDALLPAMTRVALADGRRYVPVPTTVVYPRLTTLDAQELHQRSEIASFTTYFSPANAARVNNIRQVAGLLDGTVIRPGETFSFNKTAGPRTRAAGFDEAPVIRDGVLTPGVGGGICQVSTTLFNAVFFAGLPVVDRTPHSFYIDHYPIGRDATVSYGSTDFKFRNDSDTLVLLSVTTTEQSVTVSLAAPEWDREVTYDTSEFYDMVEPRSSPDHPRRLRDPDLPKGTTSPIEPGVSGRSVVVKRTVTGASGVLFEDSFASVYRPKDYVIRVGG